MKAKIRGVYPAVVTAFNDAGKRYLHRVSYSNQKRLIHYLLEGGVNGVVVAGCTGAASVLSDDEQVNLVKHVQKTFGKKTTVIAGDGTNSTRHAIDMAQRMEQEAGVFIHLSISPYYNKPSDRGILEHYTTIADGIEGEMILYSVPGRTGGKGILPSVVEQLADHPHIIGIKEASGDMDRIRETIGRTRDKDFFVISGDDNLTLDMIRETRRVVGVISVAANIRPREVSAMVGYALNCRNSRLSGELDSILSPLYSALFPKSKGNPSPNPVMCYYALNRMGFPVGVPRLPLTKGEPEEMEQMDNVLEDLEQKCRLYWDRFK